MRRSHLLLPFLLLASCAQILSPGGGEKDRTPPAVVEYNPDSAAVNFTGKRIIIRFNEYVQLSDLNNQLIVSPQMNEQPDVNIRKKEIVIDLPDSLLPNTTYTISFGNAIKDITEGNLLDNFRYVFSTGPQIDSLTCSGKLLNAYSLSPERNVLVMLYRNTADSVPYKERPYYFTKSRDDGSFRLTNLKAGTYRIFALDDKNQNYLYDNTDERIAFADSLLVLRDHVDSLSLKLFRELPAKQKRISLNQPFSGRVSLVYARPIADPQISVSLGETDRRSLFTEHSPNGDSLDLWLGSISSDSMKIVVRDGKTPVDSAEIEIERPGRKKSSGRGGGNAELRKLRISSNASGMYPGKKLNIYTSNPVSDYDRNGIFLIKGRDTVKTSFSLSENKHSLRIDGKLYEDSSYVLFVRPGAITDWFGQKNDTLMQRFTMPSASESGTLKTEIKGLKEGRYVLQLLNEKGVVVRDTSITGPMLVSYRFLPAGGYTLKLITDANGNGKWDTGNYPEHRQAETVRYYARPVRMRTGWDLDVVWELQ